MGNLRLVPLILLGLVLLSTVAHSAFLLRSLQITIDAQKNGDAKVNEKIAMFLDSQNSVDLYKSGLSINDLGSWKERTGMSEMRYHVSSAKVSIENIRIRPQPLEKCNTVDGTCYATIIIDYTAAPILQPAGANATNQTTGMFLMENYRPRTTRYTLNPDTISTKKTDSGDILLDQYTTLTIKIPEDAKLESLQPIPPALVDTLVLPSKDYHTFTWTNAILPKMELVYTIEDPLEDEIIDFFGTLEANASNLFLGPSGAAIIIIVGISVVSFVYFNRVSGKSK
ncbi:MAG: hypothetical protein WC506_01615 [Candidatus Micrarchaeia archaeon]